MNEGRKEGLNEGTDGWMDGWKHFEIHIIIIIMTGNGRVGHVHQCNNLKTLPCTFPGWTGYVSVDSTGDRDPDYWVWSLSPGDQQFIQYARIRYATDTYQVTCMSVLRN